MPRERTVTMGKVTPQESYEAGLKKNIKLYSPFAVVDGELVGETPASFSLLERAVTVKL